QLSPLLSRKLAQHLSAGRVQSVAVRLIVEREREIQAFKPEEYWKISALFRPTALAPSAPPEPVAVQTSKGKGPTYRKKDKETGKKGDEDKNASLSPSPPTSPSDGAPSPSPEKVLPPGAFVAELAEWKGEKFKADSKEKVDPIVQALQSAAYAV